MQKRKFHADPNMVSMPSPTGSVPKTARPPLTFSKGAKKKICDSCISSDREFYLNATDLWWSAADGNQDQSYFDSVIVIHEIRVSLSISWISIKCFLSFHQCCVLPGVLIPGGFVNQVSFLAFTKLLVRSHENTYSLHSLKFKLINTMWSYHTEEHT